ncbi:MAG: hypothetical protein WC700_17265 [Gemmatimonadaceae bacterium]
MRKGDWFQTHTGVQFWPMDPRADEVRIDDIARGLAMQCRFNGHVKEFYSIAEHSVRVSHVVPPEHALWGLLHDAAEAYIGDMVRPLKTQMPAFRECEAAIMAVICERFGMTMPEPPEVKVADNVLLMTERRDLLLYQKPWTHRADPLPDEIEPWTWQKAEAEFLSRFAMLKKEAP